MRRKLLMTSTLLTICGGGWYALVPVRAMIAAPSAPVVAPSAPVAAPVEIPPIKVELPPNAVRDQLAAAQAGGNGLSSGLMSYARGGDLSVRLVGPRTALVEGSVRVGSRTDDLVYVCAVRVADPDNKTMSFNIYDHQKFTLAPGAEITPTFTDTVTVPPGRNFVQLRLYRFPKDFNPALYGDEQANEGMNGVQQSQPIEVF